jgi:hypothetical protein
MHAYRRVLLPAAVFSSPDSSTYIDDAVPLTSYLDNIVWPALGVSESLSLALNAWVHLRSVLHL